MMENSKCRIFSELKTTLIANPDFIHLDFETKEIFAVQLTSSTKREAENIFAEKTVGYQVKLIIVLTVEVWLP